MACKHENLIVMTTEKVGQTYWNNPELDERWGDTQWQEVESIDEILCEDCGEDVTDELKDKIKL